MKRSLFLLSGGLLLCSCTSEYDVVTGHARILTGDYAGPLPLTRAQLEPVAQPVAAQPVVTPPVAAPTRPAVVSQRQPRQASALPLAPATPAKPETKQPEIKPVPETVTPAAPDKKVETTGSVSQKQPAIASSAAAVKQAPKPEPAVKPAPVKKTPTSGVSKSVSQKQPAITAPPAPAPAQVIEKREPGQLYVVVKPQQPAAPATPVSQQQPRVTAPARKDVPVMPGQNRGLRNRRAY